MQLAVKLLLHLEARTDLSIESHASLISVLACDRFIVRIESIEIKRGDVHGVREFRDQYQSNICHIKL